MLCAFAPAAWDRISDGNGRKMVGLNEFSEEVAARPATSRRTRLLDPAASPNDPPGRPRNPVTPRRYPARRIAATFACLYWGLFATADLSEPIKPIPAEDGTDPAKAALGRMLFHDLRLSKDNTSSCASCHDLPTGGDDGRIVSLGTLDVSCAVHDRKEPTHSPIRQRP